MDTRLFRLGYIIRISSSQILSRISRAVRVRVREESEVGVSKFENSFSSLVFTFNAFKLWVWAGRFLINKPLHVVIATEVWLIDR